MLQDIGFLIVFESLQSNYALTISVLVLNDTVVFVKEIIVDSYQSSSSELEKKKSGHNFSSFASSTPTSVSHVDYISNFHFLY